MGIDYGSKRVGVALSDESGLLAMPLKVIINSENLVSDILDICKDKEVGEIVVGESLDFLQNENKIMRDIKPFVESLKARSGLQVHLHPEFMTSEEAERTQTRRMPTGTRLRSREVNNKMHDASAAAIILRSFLDINKNK